jgi:hypothetical protein
MAHTKNQTRQTMTLMVVALDASDLRLQRSRIGISWGAQLQILQYAPIQEHDASLSHAHPF